jgi:hypothetical protein
MQSIPNIPPSEGFMAMIKGKEIVFYNAREFNSLYGGIESLLYVKEALSVLQNHPVDMLVFQTAEEKMSIRSAGYNLFDETAELDETSILRKFDSMQTETFWLKIDDYGDRFVGTFLLPSEY